MRPVPPFRRRWPWVGADLQTIRNVLPGRLSGIAPETGRRFEIPLGDGSGDRLVARYHPAPGTEPAALLVPGLTGCEASRHVLQAAGAFLAAGHPAIRLNLRGSPPGRSLARGHYHMDRVRDLADACLAAAELDPAIRERGIVVLGYSLGGALALRLAAAPFLPAVVRAAVSISAPLDLAAAAERIARPRNRLYERWLLARLREETWPVWRRAPAAVRNAVRAARHMRDFDDALTAGEAGFRDATDYYASCSPARSLGALRVPTLIVHADDDPWVPPPAVAASSRLRVVVTRGGGHVGFHGKGSRLPWYLTAAAGFVRNRADARSAPTPP
ncbi:MAG: alpha/beta fold hydrolase [Defluviicoccus sp.]|nr:alpha/beta fold hydrolase [Defluviicoccus sp.]